MRLLDVLVRLEWLALFLAAIGFYAFAGGSWFFFLLLFLAPDLSMVGYLAGPRIGAFAYNMLHTVVWPLCLIGLGSFCGPRSGTSTGVDLDCPYRDRSGARLRPEGLQRLS